MLRPCGELKKLGLWVDFVMVKAAYLLALTMLYFYDFNQVSHPWANQDQD